MPRSSKCHVRATPAHRLEQYLTVSQSRAHFLRQVKGRAQVAQVFVGKLAFAGGALPRLVFFAIS